MPLGRPDDAARHPATPEIFLVAAEESGDRLGAALMRALRQRSSRTGALCRRRRPRDDRGGSRQPVADRRLFHHRLHCHSRQAAAHSQPSAMPTVRAILARRPHALVIIDSPAYTLRVARLVRWFDPSIPIIDYVSPTVWAWRAGRARTMRRYIDHVLALLPFEPAAHRRLGGPPCSYVGHPLIEEVAHAAAQRGRGATQARRSADRAGHARQPQQRDRKTGGIFGEALALLQQRAGPIEVVVPTVPHLLARVTQATAAWPVKSRVVVDLRPTSRRRFATARARSPSPAPRRSNSRSRACRWSPPIRFRASRRSSSSR